MINNIQQKLEVRRWDKDIDVRRTRPLSSVRFSHNNNFKIDKNQPAEYVSMDCNEWLGRNYLEATGSIYPTVAQIQNGIISYQ